MTKLMARVGHYAIRLVITAIACAVMWWLNYKPDEAALGADSTQVAALPVAAQPRSVVVAEPLEAAVRDVTIRYSGKIRPWETYTLGFEIGGRVAALGQNDQGEPLDDGDRVEAGQLLARLDDRVLRAQLNEAVANFELAASELDRARGARTVISESEFQSAVAARAQSAAAQQMAEKRLEDSILLSPVSGVIAERLVEAGESINPNEAVFEVVENDRLRLVLNVPEARVRELELRRRRVEAARASGAANDPEELVFRAHVQLEGTDLFGRPWAPIDAEVYRIAETADTVTGLFEVEVAIDNREGLMRPGMVATANLVTDRVYAYELPEEAVLFRQGQTYAFVVEPETAPTPVLFWEVGEQPLERARRIDLTSWIDLGEKVLIPADGLELGAVITRGQQRLRDGQLVRVLENQPEKSVARVDRDAAAPN